MIENAGWPKEIIPSNAQEVWEAPYPDFVGMLNQTNVMPGSYVTLTKWAAFSGISQDSKVLEVACTTGFSLRELAIMTGCTGVGFDLSHKAILAANYNLSEIHNADLAYVQANGYEFESPYKFSHIVLGSSLGFFPDPGKMMDKCLSMLQDGGYLLATSFYVDGEMPESALSKRREVFGITTSPENYKESVNYYQGLDLVYEDRNDMYSETQDELIHYCRSTVDRLIEISGIQDPDVVKAFYDRLMLVKQTSNELRKYQKYAVLILRYRARSYPRRYVELF